MWLLVMSFAYGAEPVDLGSCGADLLCVQEALESARAAFAKEQPSVAPLDARSAPLSLTEVEQRLIAACDAAIPLSPTSVRASLLTESGEILYQKNRFDGPDGAVVRFVQALSLSAATDATPRAADLLLDIYVLREEWQRVEALAEDLSVRRVGGEASLSKMRRIEAAAAWKRIESLDSADLPTSDRVRAAAYLTFADRFPEDAGVGMALNNAAIFFERAALWEESLAVRARLLDPKYQDERFYVKNLLSIAQIHEHLGRLAEAASDYERLVAIDLKGKTGYGWSDLARDIDDARYNAAILREKLGQHDRAIVHYVAYIAAHPEDRDVSHIRLRLGELYVERQRWAEASAVLSAVSRQDQLVWLRARVLLGKIESRRGHLRVRDTIYEETLRQASWSPDCGLVCEDAMGEMRFVLASRSLDAFLSRTPGQSISIPDELSAVVRALEGVASSGVWRAAALEGMGRADEAAMRLLPEGPRRDELLREAISAYTRAIAAGEEVSADSEALTRARARLATLSP